MKYALIKGTTVENCIVADAAFAAALTGYDTVIAIPENRSVGPGWRWSTAAGFTAPDSAAPSRRILTHKQFRDLLNIDEQLLLDNFTVQEYADAEPRIQALTLMQRAMVRTALATYREAQEVDLDDPATVQLVTLFGAFSLWDGPRRTAEILAGDGAQ